MTLKGRELNRLSLLDLFLRHRGNHALDRRLEPKKRLAKIPMIERALAIAHLLKIFSSGYYLPCTPPHSTPAPADKITWIKDDPVWVGQ